MNVLFITIGRMESIEIHALYPDLLRQFRDNGHNIYVVSSNEKRTGLETAVVEERGAKLLHVKIGNMTKCGIIEKGISTLLIESQFKAAVHKYFSDVRFDLVIYSTPPITFSGVVKYIKKRDNAKSYLLLKDIFPQNSVDLGMLRKTGVKGLIYKYFRRKEKQLYGLSDRIGCMSQANVDYILKHNPEIDPQKVEICPNSIEPADMSVSAEEKLSMREKYGIPQDKTVFVYGGNLGRPQDVHFIVKCLKACANIENAYFVVAGSGTDRHFLDEYVDAEKPQHVKLFGQLPKEEYDKMVACCDVGLIFLDHRFTIPNFPSRLLSYMQAKLPVLACTDPNTDIGKVIVGGGFGWWCESDSTNDFENMISDIVTQKLSDGMKNTEYSFLFEHYHSQIAYETITKIFDI